MAPSANAPAQADAKANPLDSLIAMVADDLKAVNRTIVEQMQSPVALIPQLAGHLVAAGGKRLRPVLTLATARLCGYEGAGHVLVATCVEFIHTATLLHDDVVDDSKLRRGRESANAIWGNEPSVLVGDFLFSRAFEMLVDHGDLPTMRLLSRACATLSEGEVMQLLTANDIETTRDAYLDVIRGKTAALFAAAARAGGMVAQRPEAELNALSTYGMNLGTAFQVVDDTLDYSAEQAALGKEVGDDFRDGKVTLPAILAIERGSDEERAFWQRCLGDQDIHDGDLEHAMELMRRHNALDDAQAQARAYVEEARQALEVFPDNPMRRILLDVADFSLERAF
ncbi:polyprenyl synthetase family protein [Roseospirillum parvum]|uniref:Octaprenyl diphosphate synthase n=1 Tax=Roseospirillum parvum TaxID=83401 RepID=A0A1G8AYS9_9PROT|nr:octaprenyl-diphosphate synthase [Roseospirillum parvum]